VKNKNKFLDKRGTTLVELIIVIAIIGILALIGIPEISRFSADYKVRSCATDLIQNMRVARAMAIKENRNYLITFDIANNNYRIGFDGSGDNDLLDAVDGFGTGPVRVVDTQAQYENGIVYGRGNGPAGASVTFNGNGVVFSPNGSVQAIGGLVGSVFFQNARGDSYRVVLSNISGQINVRKLNQAATDWDIEIR